MNNNKLIPPGGAALVEPDAIEMRVKKTRVEALNIAMTLMSNALQGTPWDKLPPPAGLLGYGLEVAEAMQAYANAPIPEASTTKLVVA